MVYYSETMNICFETFGCRLNRAEALDGEAKAVALGHRIVKTHAEADLVILRGCSVTARAQRDCEKAIAHLKRKYPNKRLIVTGCLPDAQKTFTLPASHATPGKDAGKPSVPTRTARAYLKIQDGCAGKCTFCIVPKFRGASVSEPFGAVLEKSAKFIAAGYREIVVTGCNLGLYASDGKRLPELLGALAGLDPRCRIRLGSLEPCGCADEVVDVMAAHANICRFLHIPVQSGSDRILTAMQRPYRVSDVERIAEKARSTMPTVSLGCDLMAGFPGESEGDFVQTKNLLLRLAFANAHVFPYSERPGTPATKLRGLIPKTVRSERAHMLSGIAKANLQRFARTFVGKDVDVVIESHDGAFKGWTGEYLWFEGPLRMPLAFKGSLHRKQCLRCTVRSADNGVLHGIPVTDGR